MSMVKRMLKLAVIGALLLSLSLLTGCSGFSITADDFLSPPRASGEMYKIEKTLKETVTTAYTLKYPTAGEYRSAYILCDLTGANDENFAIAFYSTMNQENSTFMNLKLMQKVNGDWISLSDIVVNAVGVEKVDFADLNGDGIKEITIGWNVYGGMDKKITAYTLNGLKLVPIMQENYTGFMCCDLFGDGRKELFLIHHDTITAVATAKCFSFKDDEVNTSSSCSLDGSVLSYNEPVFTKLSDGTSAILVDAVKGAGMQTEIIYYKNGDLIPAFYNPLMTENYIHPTYRNNTVASIDINSDGFLDIPLVKPADEFTSALDQSTLNPITIWSTYNGQKLTETMQTIMNYADGYYIELPKEWIGCTTVNIEIEKRLRSVSLWNIESKTVVSELVRIRAISEVNWDKPHNGFNDYVEIARNNGTVYAAMFSSYNGVEKISPDELKNIFHIIK